jgi:hypothetical protein
MLYRIVMKRMKIKTRRMILKMKRMKRFKMIQMAKKMMRISTSKLSILHLKISRINKAGLKVRSLSLLTSRWLRSSKMKPSSL